MKLSVAAMLVLAAIQLDDRHTRASDFAATCLADFMKADKDGDGALNSPEIAGVPDLVPQSLLSKPRITKAEYLAACDDANGNSGHSLTASL